MQHNPIGGIFGAAQDAIIARREAASAPKVYDGAKTDRLLAQLRAERDVALAKNEAALAQVQALKVALSGAVPTHPLLQLSNEKYRADGTLKSKLRLLWEAAFDKKLKEISPQLGANAKAYRKD